MEMTIDTCGNIYPNPIADEINRIVEEVTETHEKFVFKTIQPFCEFVVEKEISKDDLTHALLLWKNYDKRLREDMMAMLVEISLEADELSPDYDNDTYLAGICDYDNLIQQKINALKGNSCGNNKRKD